MAFSCGEKEAACRFIDKHIDESDFGLCYLRKQDVEFLESRFHGLFTISHSAGDSEYIVDRAEHIALPGKSFAKLRNKVHKAEREHVIETMRLTEENKEEAMAIIQAWRGTRKAQGTLHMYGDEEDAEPIKLLEQLGITGILMKVDGEPFGVAASFMLSEDTSDLFLAKENAKDPALGYYLRRELMRLLPETVRYVNLEDDLEIEGLRTMKKQMIPVRMNEMWMAVRNEKGRT